MRFDQYTEGEKVRISPLLETSGYEIWPVHRGSKSKNFSTSGNQWLRDLTGTQRVKKKEFLNFQLLDAVHVIKLTI